MVQALLNLSENSNRVLNVIKAKYNFRDKSEAVEFIVQEFVEKENEPELKPDFIEKIKSIEKKGKFSRYKSLSKLRKELENA